MKFTSRVFGWLLSLSLGVALVLGITHVRAIEDWVALRNYIPPAYAVQFATQDTMTPLGTHIFYVNHPALESNVSQFRGNCQVAEQAIVLGCYHPNQAGIFLYDVTDVRLNGVEQVTAAHEMLHGAYDRLSSKEKKTIDAELLDYYNNDLQDQRIKDEIDGYKKTEPNDVVNEMHSVFGTEVANLPAPLENYYKRYFVNRAVITTFAANYEDEFTSREAQVNADDAKLSGMKVQIQSDEQSLQTQLASLQADRAGIENSDSQSDIDQYNSRVNTYNAGVGSLQAEIAAYNALVVQRNAIASDLASLQSSLDTRLTAQPAQ